MPRYRLTIAYEGTRYHGWQKQEPPVVDGGRAPGDQADAESMFALKSLMTALGSANLDCRQDGAA